MGQASGRAKGQQASLPPTEDTAASHTEPLEERVVSASLAARAAEGPSEPRAPRPHPNPRNRGPPAPHLNTVSPAGEPSSHPVFFLIFLKV